MQTNLFNPEAAQSLFDSFDWNSIISKLGSQCFFEASKRKISSFSPLLSVEISSSLDRLEVIGERLDFYKNHFSQNSQFLDSSIETYKRFLEFEKGHSGDLTLLNYVTLQYEMFQSSFGVYKELGYISESLFSPSVLNSFRKVLLNEFRKVINQDATINYNSHPILKSLYKEQQKLEIQIREIMTKLPRSSTYEKAVQYPEYDILFDHFVLAIKSDSYNSKMGQIIGRSSSGNTLLVEPSQIRELGNARLQVNAKIEEFLNAIYRQVSGFIFDNYNIFQTILDQNIQFDLDISKSSYCFNNDFTRPLISSDFKVKLDDFFNPLLDEPIKNNILIEHNNHGVIISGPNTGGKSVVLKSVTLCYMFLHLGMFVPASNAELSIINGLYFLSSDLQDISEGLSSFSSEVQNYLDLLNQINGNSLIVIDEIFNSTASEEASVLAAGLIDYICSKSNIKLLVSTHHKKLKNFIYDKKQLISAHMGFDKKDHSPNYKLYMGEPGSSYALSIFQKLGKGSPVSKKIFNNIEAYQDDEGIDLESILEEISNKNQLLENEKEKISKELTEIRNKTKAFEVNIEMNKGQILANYERKLKKQLDKSEKLLESVRKNEVKSKKALYSKISEIRQGFNKDGKLPSLEKHIPRGEAVDFSNLESGITYFSSKTNSNVLLEQINLKKKTALAIAGSMKVRVPLDSIFESKEAMKQQIVKITIDRTVRGDILVDGRGLRLEEFQKIIYDSIVDLESGEIPFLDIIHGHGEGILKKWVRGYLTKNKDLSWEAEEGNDGVTKVKLKV